jgi:DNA helicase-4
MLLMAGMKIRSGLFGGLISGGGRWELAFDEQSIVYAKAGRPDTGIPLGTITRASAKPGLIWSTIEIVAPDQRIVAKGSLNRAAEDFVGPLWVAIGRALLSELERLSPALLQFANTWRKLLEHPRYISNYDVETWKKAIPPTDYAVLIRILALLRNPLMPSEGSPPETRLQLDLLVDVLSGPRSQVKIRNEQFVAGEVTRFKDFFDRVEPTPLTAEQRTASIVLEDCNLLVAAAGSGKTSTVVGKVGYTLLTKQCDPKDFLVLAFNNDAAKELDVVDDNYLDRVTTTILAG